MGGGYNFGSGRGDISRGFGLGSQKLFLISFLELSSESFLPGYEWIPKCLLGYASCNTATNLGLRLGLRMDFSVMSHS